MTNYSFSHIPPHMWSEITEKEHVEYRRVYRLVDNAAAITMEDFLPSIIADDGKSNLNKLDSYSVSLLYDKINVEEYKKRYRSLQNKEVVCGPTKIQRGISHQHNKKGHIDYFLFDYANNNPYTDFGDCNE